MARSNQTALTPTKKSTLRPTAPKNHIPSFILAATLALLTFIAWQQLNSPSGLNTPSPLPANHPPAPSPAHVPPPPSPQPPTSTSPTPTTQPLGNPIVPVTTEPTLTVSSQPLADPPVASPLRSAPDAACCASATLARRSLVPNGADSLRGTSAARPRHPDEDKPSPPPVAPKPKPAPPKPVAPLKAAAALPSKLPESPSLPASPLASKEKNSAPPSTSPKPHTLESPAETSQPGVNSTIKNTNIPPSTFFEIKAIAATPAQVWVQSSPSQVKIIRKGENFDTYGKLLSISESSIIFEHGSLPLKTR